MIERYVLIRICMYGINMGKHFLKKMESAGLQRLRNLMTENCRGLILQRQLFIAYGYQPVMITANCVREELRNVQETGRGIVDI